MRGPFNSETIITLSKRELLSLLFKLDREESSCALLRRGENGKEYYIKAISDEEAYEKVAVPPIHLKESSRIRAFEKWEAQEKLRNNES